MKKVFLAIISITSLIFLGGCNSELTPELAKEIIASQPEFKNPFFAPFNIGDEILNGDNHKNSDKYIKEHLGSLHSLGLVEAKVVESNSWRTILQIGLTKEGEKYSDPSRLSSKSAYVNVCRVTPTEITDIRIDESKRVAEVDFVFTLSDITPFGEHLGFENGVTHQDTRTLVRKGGKWNVQ